MDPVIPFTFPTRDAYAEIERPLDKRLRADFDFRTYNKDGLLLLNPFDKSGRFQVNFKHKSYVYDVMISN